LGWKAGTEFEEGINTTIEWYRNNRHWWEKMLWMRHVPIKLKNGKIEMH
jgi:dTDP-glucose 4,6-dehydratase